MYLPPLFKETDQTRILGLIARNPLAALVVNDNNEFEVNHIPFVPGSGESEPLKLHAHIPRSNSLSSALLKSKRCVAIFNDADGYISPSWYATKREHGRVVPTWNYSIVHVHGEIVVKDDPDWVRAQLELLTENNERGRDTMWRVSDAPADYIEKQISMLVGLEIVAEKVDAKTKASQNQPAVNKESVLRSLESEQPESALRTMMVSSLTVKE